MRVLQLAIVFWAAAGLTAFAVWTVHQFITRSLPPKADWTTWLVYRSGQGFVWLAGFLAAGAVFGVAARAAWTLVPS